MGISVSLTNRRQQSINPVLFARQPTDLKEELEDYKRETHRLARIYELHRKLGETLDLDSMLEAFSSWLSPFLGHELVAYRHFGRERTPTACSCHGPYRQNLIEVAMDLMQHPVKDHRQGQLDSLGMYFQLWVLDVKQMDCLLLIHSEDNWLTKKGEVEEVLEDLRGPLDRALVYEELYDQARRDALTGLVNRRVFQERAEQERIQAERYNHPLVLACLDLDHFKTINDNLGHGEGDLVLKKVSQTFSFTVRGADLLARIGGDEFAMILPNTTLVSAKQLMERLCASVKALNIRSPGSHILGVSIGLSQWARGDSLAQWWEKSDAALYRAKAAGRSRVSV